MYYYYYYYYFLIGYDEVRLKIILEPLIHVHALNRMEINLLFTKNYSVQIVPIR